MKKFRTRTPNVPPYFWLYTVLQIHCKRQGKSNDLSFKDFLEFTKISQCHYCDRTVNWPKCSRRRDEKGNLLRNKSGYQLDRKENDKGYSLENCVVCCQKCNSIKGSSLNYKEMLLLRQGLKAIVMAETS
jgi:hypothetical protein